MKTTKPFTIFFSKFLIIALSLSFTNVSAQKLEVGAFLSKHRNFGYVYGKSESSTKRDRFRSFSSFKEGGGIQGTYYFKDNWGLRGGFRYVPAEYDLYIKQSFTSVLSMEYFLTLKSKLFQLPVGIVYRVPLSNGQKSFKIFLDVTADVRRFNVEFDRASLTVGPERPQSVFQTYSFNPAPKTNFSAGADFGFGFTPFKCKNIELNALYHHSFSYLDVVDYQSHFGYTDQNNSSQSVAGTGTMRVRPNYVMAQLVYYFISR